MVVTRKYKDQRGVKTTANKALHWMAITLCSIAAGELVLAQKTMNQTNRYGLSRHIPEAIARSIRKRCGFGCVRCGRAIYEYHHFNPPFEDAKEHREDGITLLCPNCHGDQHKGLLSRGTVEQCNENPKCLERGFSSHWLDLKGSPEVVLGHITFINTPNMIEAFGESLLAIEGPEDCVMPLSVLVLCFTMHRDMRSLESAGTNGKEMPRAGILKMKARSSLSGSALAKLLLS